MRTIRSKNKSIKKSKRIHLKNKVLIKNRLQNKKQNQVFLKNKRKQRNKILNLKIQKVIKVKA